MAEQSDGNHHHVLIAEDDQDLQDALKVALEGIGCTVFTSSTCADLVFRLNNKRYDLLILDLRLKDDSTTKIISRVRKTKTSANAKTPIILISGYMDKTVVSELGPLINCALVKPFTNSQLKDKAREILDR